MTFVTPEGLVVGDVLFRESVGRADLPGGDWETLVRSIRGRLFSFPKSTAVYPGHGPVTTIGHEMKVNPFVGASATPAGVAQATGSPAEPVTTSDLERMLLPSALYRDFLSDFARVRAFYPCDFRDPAGAVAAARARDYPA